MTPSSSHLLRITLLSSVAALGGFLFGYDSGVINGMNGVKPAPAMAGVGRRG